MIPRRTRPFGQADRRFLKKIHLKAFIIRKVPVNFDCAIEAGGSYSLEQTKFNRICRQIGDPITATLMLNTGPYAPFCRVFSTRNLETADESQVHSFTVEEVRSKLEGVLEKYLEQNG